MTILVTGAAGFIGSNLANRLLDKEYKVIGIDNYSFGEKRNIASILDHPNFKFIEQDLCSYALCDKVDKVDVIVHLASMKIPRYTNSYKTLYVNDLLLKNVLEKAKLDRAHLVFASTSDVYGKNNALPFSENSNLVLGSTQVKRWAYACSKMYAEHAIIAHAQEFDFTYTLMRFFGAYGPNQNLSWWGGPQSVFIQKALSNQSIEIHGDGQQTRTFTYIDDTIQGILLCMEHQKSRNEIFNIASDKNEEVSIFSLAEKIWKKIHGLNAQPKLEFIPYSAFGKYEDVSRRVPCVKKIKKQLGFSSLVGLDEGLEKTIAWQRNISNLGSEKQIEELCS